MLTFQDAFDSLLGYMGAAPSTDTRRDARQCIDEGLRELINGHNWSYLYEHGRVNTHAPYTTGTIDYQLSTGALPRLVTLTDGVWPDWAFGGSIRIGNVVYMVDQVIDATTLTLTDDLSPVVDLPPGTAYAIYQDIYPLSEDFIAQDQAIYESCFGGLQFVHPREWLAGQRWVYQVGVPRYYSITGDKKYPGRLCVRLSPTPVDNRTLDYIFKRRSRPLIWQNEGTGTITIAQGTPLVAGVGTVFHPTMKGSVLRLSANKQPPTWMPGSNPFVYEGIIRTVVDAQTVYLSEPCPYDFIDATYLISDPIDIECGSMQNAFLRSCEAKVAQHRVMKDKPNALSQYKLELVKAKEADSRSFAGRAEGDGRGGYRQRAKDCPMGPDAY